MRATGQPSPEQATFTVADPTLPYRLAVLADGVTSAILTLNGLAVFNVSDFNPNVQLLSAAVELDTANELTVELRGSPGQRLTVAIVGVGGAPPAIQSSVVPAPNAAGWNNTDVTVSFACSSASIPIELCTDPVVVSTETPGLVVSGLARDAAGNTANASVTVRLDKTPPVLQVTSPVGGAVFPTPPQISGTATDALSGLAGVTCNGEAAALSQSAFVCNIVVVQGLDIVTVAAIDFAGNASSVVVEMGDTPAPAITLTQPAHLSYLNISPTTVTGTVSDPQATVTVNSLAATVVNGQFSMALPLREGPNIITATATSPGGAVGTASIEVTLDTTPPHVTITSPPDKFVTTEAALTVAGNVNDIVVGTVNDEQAQVRVNGVQAQVANRTFLAMDIPLSIGENIIQAVGRDRVGNAATTQITVTRQAPAASQIRLISGNNQTAAIGAELADPLLVALVDSSGAPVPNQTVIFKVTQNDGLISAGGAGAATVVATTNAQGQAQAAWTLGMRSGAGGNVVEAYSVGFGGTAIFTATGTQGPAGKIVVDTGNAQVGEINRALPKPFIAVVVDDGNNRLAGVPVTFTVKEGGGNFGGQTGVTVVSDSDGRVAATLTLGFQEGDANNLVEADFPSNAGFPVAFTASGRAPGDPAKTTISGVVLDNSNLPIPGVTIRAVLTNQMTSNGQIVGSLPAVQTNAEGQFAIAPAPVGLVKLLVDGSTAQRVGTYPTLDYDLVTVTGQNNTVGAPIFLLPLNVQNQLCVTATTGGGTLAMPDAPGFSLTFAPGQVTFPGGSKTGCVSVTAVHSDKVPMSPGFGQQPRFIVTIQPAGAMFNPPAAITLPNVDGLAPRAVTEMYSFDHDIGSFVAIGSGTVSEDGLVIRSSPGVGVIKAGWHCGGDPQTRGTVADCPVCNFCQGATASSATCIPDPGQIGRACSNPSNSCYSGAACGLDASLGFDRPTGVCEGGSPLPDGTACDSGGQQMGACRGGLCRGSGNSCPADCPPGSNCVNGQCEVDMCVPSSERAIRVAMSLPDGGVRQDDCVGDGDECPADCQGGSCLNGICAVEDCRGQRPGTFCIGGGLVPGTCTDGRCQGHGDQCPSLCTPPNASVCHDYGCTDSDCWIRDKGKTILSIVPFATVDFDQMGRPAVAHVYHLELSSPDCDPGLIEEVITQRSRSAECPTAGVNFVAPGVPFRRGDKLLYSDQIGILKEPYRSFVGTCEVSLGQQIRFAFGGEMIGENIITIKITGTATQLKVETNLGGVPQESTGLK